jgi:hypothetical protein
MGSNILEGLTKKIDIRERSSDLKEADFVHT